jgi:nicotinamidase-related amidase
MTDSQLPPLWKDLGFTADDVNAANDYAWDVCLPNAIRVVNACRSRHIKVIFLHWGFRCADGADLDPVIYRSMIENHGGDPRRWPGYIEDEGSRPAAVLDVQPGEYVVAKTGQDAFTSSNLDFILRNLGIRRILFIGGHTEACLGKTAASAKARGYNITCIEDATNNARESSRRSGIEAVGYHEVLSAQAFLQKAQSPTPPSSP